MAKKILKDPSEGNKNLGRGVGALLNPVDNQKKEKEKNNRKKVRNNVFFMKSKILF